MRLRLFALGALSLLSLSFLAAPALAQSFQGLGFLPGGKYSTAHDVSSDGSVVAGQCFGPSGNLDSFRWTAENGMISLGANTATGVSADGSVIVGQSSSSKPRPFRWTASEGLVELGDLPGGYGFGYANAVSADGAVIIGQSSSASGDQAFRWTSEGGMVGLGYLPGVNFSYANAVSADGAVVVGGGFSSKGELAFRWTADEGIVELGDLPDGVLSSMATGVSDDGSVVIGQAATTSGGEAFRWTRATGMVGLGDLPGGYLASLAAGISADGSVIVGQGYSDTGLEAFLWDSVEGMRSLQDILINEYGLASELEGWNLTWATSLSADGRVIVGQGTNPDGFTEAWIAKLGPAAPVPEPDIWTFLLFFFALGVGFFRRQCRQMLSHRCRSILYGLSLLSLSCLSSPARAQSTVNVTLNPTDDSYVQYGNLDPTHQLGIATTVNIKRQGVTNGLNRCAYLKFDLTNYATAPTAANLTLTVNSISNPNGSALAIKCFVVSNNKTGTNEPWTEGDLLYTNAPNLDIANWLDTGGTLAGTQSVLIGTTTTVTYDLTSVVAANQGKKLSLQLISEDTSNAAVAFNSKEAATNKPTLTLTLPTLTDTPLPSWALSVLPTDTGGSGGDGPASSLAVNLASGVLEHDPGADLTVRNPIGPTAVYARMYHSGRAKAGYGSPGLPPGWIDNWDITIAYSGPTNMAGAPTAWGPFTLTYPNGAVETVTPTLSGGGSPTGDFTSSLAGASYKLKGAATGTLGRWSSFTFRFPDQTGWIIKPSSNPDFYWMERAFNVLSQGVYVFRTGNKISALRNETGDLLRFTYNNPGGLLSRIFDNTVANRYVDYTVGAGGGTTELLSVSRIGLAAPAWLYEYAVPSQAPFPFLTRVGVPLPRPVRCPNAPPLPHPRGRP